MPGKRPVAAANNVSRTLRMKHKRVAKPGVHASDMGHSGFRVLTDPVAGGVRVMHILVGRFDVKTGTKAREHALAAYAKTLREAGYVVHEMGEGVEGTLLVTSQ